MSQTGDTHVSRNADDSGFTLIELLVVLAVMALVAAVVTFPLTSSRVEKLRAESVARALAADLRQSRHEAINSGEIISVTFNRTAPVYMRGRELRKVPSPVTLAISGSTTAAEEPQISFFPDGTSTGGTVKVIAGDNAYEVSVSWPFGRVEINE